MSVACGRSRIRSYLYSKHHEPCLYGFILKVSGYIKWYIKTCLLAGRRVLVCLRVLVESIICISTGAISHKSSVVRSSIVDSIKTGR